VSRHGDVQLVDRATRQFVVDTSVESGDVGRFLHNGTSIGHEYTGRLIYFNNNCFAQNYLFLLPLLFDLSLFDSPGNAILFKKPHHKPT
jgi:hypothetical protein